MDNPEKLATWGHTRGRKTNQKHNRICVGHYRKKNKNNVNKT
jgi:hypothetical protein